MEAIALYDYFSYEPTPDNNSSSNSSHSNTSSSFTADKSKSYHNSSQTLSFKKECKIIITAFSDYAEWFRAELDVYDKEDENELGLDDSINHSNVQFHKRQFSTPSSMTQSNAQINNNHQSPQLIHSNSAHLGLRENISQSARNNRSQVKSDYISHEQFSNLYVGAGGVGSYRSPHSSGSGPSGLYQNNNNNIANLSYRNSNTSINSNISFTSSGTPISSRNKYKTRSKSILKGLVPKNYFHVKPCPYFYGPISRNDADEILNKIADPGEFLIRQNNKTHQFVLSVKHLSGNKHYKILRDQMGNYLIFKSKFSSVNKLVEFYYENSLPVAPSRSLKSKSSIENSNKLKAEVGWGYRNREQELTMGLSQNQNHLPIPPSDGPGKIFIAQYDYNPEEHEQNNTNTLTTTTNHHNQPSDRDYQNIDIDLPKPDNSRDEIKIMKDDRLLLLDERSGYNDGWWLGQLLPDPEVNISSYFQVGMFPKDYVIGLGS